MGISILQTTTSLLFLVVAVSVLHNRRHVRPCVASRQPDAGEIGLPIRDQVSHYTSRLAGPIVLAQPVFCVDLQTHSSRSTSLLCGPVGATLGVHGSNSRQVRRSVPGVPQVLQTPTRRLQQADIPTNISAPLLKDFNATWRPAQPRLRLRAQRRHRSQHRPPSFAGSAT